MKQYKFTVVVNSPMNIKDILWAFTHKLKDAFPIVSISFDEVSNRPTTVEHHGGDLSKNGGDVDSIAEDYKDIPERY